MQALLIDRFDSKIEPYALEAAGLSVIVYEIIQEHGIARLGIVVLIAGIFQMVAGLARTGQWFRAVSPAVVNGMLSGIGVLILASQFHVTLARYNLLSSLEIWESKKQIPIISKFL